MQKTPEEETRKKGCTTTKPHPGPINVLNSLCYFNQEFEKKNARTTSDERWPRPHDERDRRYIGGKKRKERKKDVCTLTIKSRGVRAPSADCGARGGYKGTRSRMSCRLRSRTRCPPRLCRSAHLKSGTIANRRHTCTDNMRQKYSLVLIHSHSGKPPHREKWEGDHEPCRRSAFQQLSR